MALTDALAVFHPRRVSLRLLDPTSAGHPHKAMSGGTKSPPWRHTERTEAERTEEDARSGSIPTPRIGSDAFT